MLVGKSSNNRFKITSPSFELRCATQNFTGTVTENGVKEVTLRATYYGTETEPSNEKCDSSFGKMTVTMNGCDYVLSGNTLGLGEGSDATVWIQCPPGKAIQLLYTPEPKVFCKIFLAAQTPTSGGATYTNGIENEKKDVTVKLTATGITYSTEGSLCALAGLAKEGSNGDYTGTVTATGYTDLCGEVEGGCPFAPKEGKEADEYTYGTPVSIEVS